MQSPTMISFSGSLSFRAPPTPMAPLGYSKPLKICRHRTRRRQGHADASRVKVDLTLDHHQEGRVTNAGPIDGKLGAVDIARLLVAQEIDGLGHLLGLSESPYRNAGNQRLGARR